MTTQDIVTRFQRLLQETSPRFFNTAWQIEAINDSIEDIFDELVSVNPEWAGMALAHVQYVQGQQEYALPAQPMQVIKVEVTDMGGPPYPVLRPIDFREVGRYVVPVPTLPQLTAAGQGEPLAYYLRQPDPSSGTTYIGFDPIPYRSAVAPNVNIWYVQKPSLISTIDANTVPDLPPDVHRLIPLRMCVLACMADASPRTGFYVDLYNAALQRAMMRAAHSRQGAREEITLAD